MYTVMRMQQRQRQLYYTMGITHLLVKKRFGERQPAFDGHHDGYAPRAQPEEPPQDADPARPHVVLGARPLDAHEHLDQHASERDAIVGGQAPQHEPVLLVAARPGPVQYEKRQQVAEYPEPVQPGNTQLHARILQSAAGLDRKHQRRGRRRRGRVRHGQLHRIAVVFCAAVAFRARVDRRAISPPPPFPSHLRPAQHNIIINIIIIIPILYDHLYSTRVCRVFAIIVNIIKT